MNHKVEGCLKHTWEASVVNFRPAIGMTTCVARTFDVWLDQLKAHLLKDTPTRADTKIPSCDGFYGGCIGRKPQNLPPGPLLKFSQKGYLAKDLPRRPGIQSQKLCHLPFEGNHLFSLESTSVLERSADRKEGFPPPKNQIMGEMFLISSPPSISSRRPGGKRGKAGPLRKRWGGRISHNLNDLGSSVGERLRAFLPQEVNATQNQFILDILRYGYRIE